MVVYTGPLALGAMIFLLALLVFLRYHHNPETRAMFVEPVAQTKRFRRVVRLLS